ncbi:MAG: hypothetical protein PHO08_12670 [Methylococcales bacterium]|nr:hypothetical protein [Methylococcales bacterium]
MATQFDFTSWVQTSLKTRLGIEYPILQELLPEIRPGRETTSGARPEQEAAPTDLTD